MMAFPEMKGITHQYSNEAMQVTITTATNSITFYDPEGFFFPFLPLLIASRIGEIGGKKHKACTAHLHA